MKSVHEMPFGAAVDAAGGVRFALWAPGAERVALELLDRATPEQAAAVLPLQPTSAVLASTGVVGNGPVEIKSEPTDAEV